MYCLFGVVLFIVCVSMCTVLLPPGDNPIAVNKYIISYHMYKDFLVELAMGLNLSYGGFCINRLSFVSVTRTETP